MKTHSVVNLQKQRIIRYIVKALIDIFLFGFAYILAFLIRFDFSFPNNLFGHLQFFLPYVVTFRFTVFLLFRIYRDDYSYFSIPNVLLIFKAVTLSTILMGLAFLTDLIDFKPYPRSILIIDWLLLFSLICGSRYLIKRIRHGLFHRITTPRERILIIGTGEMAESLLRRIVNYNHHNFYPVGLVEDESDKKGMLIQGIKVLGNMENLPQLVKKFNIATLIVAIPMSGTVPAAKNRLCNILHKCNGLNVKIYTIPALREIREDRLLTHQLQQVKPEDILFRKQVEWNGECDFAKEITGKKILVTGAGGSIGSELCRQIAIYNPEKLILFERCEYNLFAIFNELEKAFPNQTIYPHIADVVDYESTSQILQKYKPDVIFHTAAYKHVYLVEINPEVAIKNNVIGTMNISRAATEVHVPKLVLISSDKAANPINVMGATKKICEEYVQAISRTNGNRFFGVRFGNVLGSSGSVLEIFKEQIANGGPVTVTDVDVSRYFMTIPEAVHLVLQTLAFAKGGEIFILDMGEPVKIYDFAKNVIQQAGLKPEEDIEIVFTGLKPGEKMKEELFEKNECLEETPHEKILRVKTEHEHKFRLLKLTRDTKELLFLASQLNRPAMIEKIRKMLPTFQGAPLEGTTPSELTEDGD